MIDYEKEIDEQFEPQVGTRQFKNVKEAVDEINKAYEARDALTLEKTVFDFATYLSRKGVRIE